MGSALLAGILSAVATTAGNIALSERQKNYNESMQDKMNQYNLPVNQVQRLKDAGLSPNALSMGSNGMTVQGNTSAGVNPYTTPDLRDPMGMISNSFLTMAQGSTEEQMREIRKQQAAADIELMNANAAKLGVDTQYQGILNAFAAAKEHASLVGQFRSNELSLWQTKKVKEEARQLAKYIDEIMPEELKQIIASQQLTVGQLDEIIANIAKIKADTSKSEAEIANIEAQTEGQEKENARYDEVTDKILEQYNATINNLTQQANLTEQQAFYYLYELCRKYGIKVLGLPVPTQGGMREIGLNKAMQNKAGEQYAVENW